MCVRLCHCCDNNNHVIIYFHQLIHNTNNRLVCGSPLIMTNIAKHYDCDVFFLLIEDSMNRMKKKDFSPFFHLDFRCGSHRFSFSFQFIILFQVSIIIFISIVLIKANHIIIYSPNSH